MIIGLDGGGTKTTGMVVDEQGRILAEATVGPTNPNSSDYETVKKELKKLFYFFTLKKPLTKEDIVFAGISGVESGGKKEWFLSLLREITGVEPTIVIDNDAITALYSETKGKPGIVCISGTGSISFGINDKEERARVGGWGYLIQDGSSGFSIGKRLLDYVFERYDKGDAPCELTKAVLEHFGVTAMSEIVSLVYELRKTRDRVASLGSIVISFSNKGNQVCVDIQKEAAACMLKEIHTLYEKLHREKSGDEKFPIVLTGGIIQHSRVMQSYLVEEAAKQKYPFAFTLPSLPPIAGAIHAAIKSGKHDVAPTFTEVFEKEVKERRE